MISVELPPEAIRDARNAASMVAPPFTQESIATTPYPSLSDYERTGVLASVRL